MGTPSFLRRAALSALIVAPALSHAWAAEPADRAISGPVAARVLKVRDGDTVEVEASIWPQQVVRTAVRLRGIDAPELKGHCEAEREAAKAARDRLAAILSEGEVTLSDISGDKYFGRVLAGMAAPGTPDISKRLLSEGLVAPYRGEKRRDWCAGAAAVTTPAAKAERG